MTPAGGASRFLHSQIDTLPAIAVIETGRDFPLTTLKRFPDRTHALFDLAAARYPVRALAALDRASRAWLKRWENAHLDEIDERRGGRVVDRVALEMRSTRKGTGGSNPSLSASFQFVLIVS
jgi:hypothetical protein